MSLFLTLLLVSYPLVIHLSIRAERADIAIYFIAAILLLPLLFNVFRARRPALWMMVMAGLSLMVGYLGYRYAASMIVIPPLLIFSGLFLFFGYSLRAEGTPVITRFAELILGEVEPDVRAYTRKATMAWMIFFLVMLLISLALALWAPLTVWSWFANFMAYLLIAVMFVVEFAVRRYCLPHHVDYSFFEFLRNLRRVDYRHVIK
jgi:uncharacterized membrane protein